MSRRLPALVLATIVAGSILPACEYDSEHDRATTPAESESVLRRGNGGDPGSLDPARAEDIHAFRVLGDLYEGLLSIDAAGTLVNGVARDWHVSEDGLTYTFELRSDAAWSNGEPVLARHFVAGFQRTLAPNFESAYSFLLSPIRNATSVQNGTLPMSALGVSASGERSLVIELEAPAAHFPALLAMPIAYPLAPGTDEFADPQTFVGNGPYVLRQWQRGHRIRLAKNPLFREANSVAIEYVEYYAIDNLVSEYNMYRAGELDITASVPANYVDELIRSRPAEFRSAPKLGLYYLAFDLGEPPLNDIELRKALSMAIDRDALVRITGRGEQPAFGIVPDGIPGYAPARYEWRTLSGEARNELARRALAASDVDQPLAITLIYDTGDLHERVALAVAAMWHDVLGIEVRLDKREWQYFLDTRGKRDQWQVMRFAWIGDYNHPNTFAELFHSQSEQNLPGYANPAYDRQLTAAQSATNPMAQMRGLAAAESLLLADYPLAPLYFYVSKHLVNPRLEGFAHNALDLHPSRYLSFSPAGVR